LVGKDAIVEFLKADLDSNTISFKTKEVFPPSDGNQVVEIGYFELLDSSSIVINTGNYMTLFEKRNGKYVSVRDMSVSNVPVHANGHYRECPEIWRVISIIIRRNIRHIDW
jgi:hypothetical protein